MGGGPLGSVVQVGGTRGTESRPIDLRSTSGRVKMIQNSD